MTDLEGRIEMSNAVVHKLQAGKKDTKVERLYERGKSN